jgi:prevent-host-death family protein
MKTAAVTDLKNRLSHYLRLFARGETVTVLERGKPIAQITRVANVDADLERLAAQGLARLPLQPLPPNFWKRPRARSSAPVSEALLEDREDRF